MLGHRVSCVLLGSIAIATAQPPDPSSTLTCASPGTRVECAADTSKGVALRRTTSTAACTLGTTWGYDADSIWVKDGCAGEFVIGTSDLFIIVGATTFSQILSFSGATNGLISLVQDAQLPGWTVLLAMMLILLMLGCFVDQVSMMLITLPFYMPLVQHYGFEPLWFGVMYLICMQLGLLTPPFGMLLFTMRSVAPKSVATGEIFRAVTPYVLFGLLMLAMVMLMPALATWLPGTLLGR